MLCPARLTRQVNPFTAKKTRFPTVYQGFTVCQLSYHPSTINPSPGQNHWGISYAPNHLGRPNFLGKKCGPELPRRVSPNPLTSNRVKDMDLKTISGWWFFALPL